MAILLRAVFILFLFSGCRGHTRKVEIDPDTGFRIEYTTDTKSNCDGPYIKEILPVCYWKKVISSKGSRWAYANYIFQMEK
jgi:hypothetical protein